MALEAIARSLGRRIRATAAMAPTIGGTIALTSQRGTVRRGTQELLAYYSETPWLRAIMGKVAFSVGTNAWEVWQETGRTPGVSRTLRSACPDRRKRLRYHIKQGDVRPLPHHEALSVFERPNPYMTGTEATMMREVHATLVGDAFDLVEWREIDSTPSGLWPLPSTWVRDVPGPGKPAEFEVQALGGGGTQRYPLEQMVWCRDLDPLNPYGRGSGYGRSLSDEIDADELAAKHQKAIMHNQARADMLIKVPGASPSQLKEFQENWLSKLQGIYRTKLPFFSSRETMEVQELGSQSLADLQLVELRKFERDLIIAVFGAPPEKLGIITSSNRATIDAADFFYAKDVIVPRLVRQRDAFNMPGRFITRWGDDLYMDYVSPVEEDRAHQLEVMKAAGYAFTDDEKRALADHEELPNDAGKVQRVPLALISEPVGRAPLRVVDDPDLGDEDDELNAPVALSVKADASNKEAIDRIVRAIKLATLRRYGLPPIQDMYIAAAQAALDEIGIAIEFNVTDPHAVEFLERRAGDKIRRVNNTTRRAIRDQLVEGFGAGEGNEKLAKRVESVFEKSRGHRARVIARTESTRASAYGSEEGIRQGGVEEKEWLATLDDATRDSHSALNGMHVPVGHNFTSPVTGATGPGPGEMGDAAEDVNCRCDLVAHFPDEARSIAGNPERAARVWKARDRQRRARERQMVQALGRAFDEQREDVLAALRGDSSAL